MFYFILYSTEQQFSLIEKQLISCNAKLESEQKQHERLKKEHEETGETEACVFRLFQSTVSSTALVNPVSYMD